MRSFKRCGEMVVVAFVVCGILRAEAATRSWTNSAGGSWEVPGNWDPNGSPTNTDDISISAGSTYTVNVNNVTADTGDPSTWLTVNTFLIQGPGGSAQPNVLVDFTNTAKVLAFNSTLGDSFQVRGNGRFLLNDGSVLLNGGYQLGHGSTGSMVIAGGVFTVTNGPTSTSFISTLGTLTQLGGIYNSRVSVISGLYNLLGGTNISSSSFILGNTAADNGTLILDGGVLTNSATFYVGNSGRGTFIISNGTFRGNNMSFGDNGGTGAGGDFNIFGGNARLVGNMTLGTATITTGRVLVAGGTLTVTNGPTTIGQSGVGTFVVSNGIFNGSTVIVSGPNSSLSIYGGNINVTAGLSANATSTGRIVSAGGILSADSVVIGSSLQGAWTISGGSNNISTALTLGQAAGSYGNLLMSGGTLDVAAGTFIGNSGRGTMTLSNGTFRGNTMSIGDAAAAAGGEFNLYGGSAGLANTLVIGNAVGSTGSVLLAGGALTVSNATTVGSNGKGSLVVSNGSFNGGSLSIGGPSGRVEQHGGTIALTGSMTINAAAGQTNTVHTTGGTLSVGGSATVGFTQNGVWTIDGGSNVITGNLSIADAGASSRGKVVMNGGSLSVGGTTYMANSGRATFIMSNGTFTANAVSMGDNPLGGGDWTIVGGSGSVGGSLRIGNNLNSTSSVTVANSGLLEIKSATTLGHPGSPAGSNIGIGTLTNRDGGTLRFTGQTDPGIAVNAGSTAIVQNAIIEFKDTTAASLVGNITKITQFGDNTFSLNNATNSAVGSYTFKTNNGQNFAYLRLINGGTRWQSTDTTIGVGGTLLASNTIGTVQGVVTNLGAISVKNSKLTFENEVVISGSYVSDPSTNTYLADVTVTQSGTLAGGVGDLFDFKKSLFINSTNHLGFNLANSAVQFSGGGMHTNAITGMDLGGAIGAHEAAFTLQTNFAYGELHLGSATDQICFTCGNIPVVPSNGLYIGWLDLLGNVNLVTNLHAASTINLYYDATDSRNAYLGGATYQLTDCNFVGGGGFLMAVIPEPTSLALLATAGMLSFLRRRK